MDRRVHAGLRPARVLWIAAALVLMAGAVNAARWRLLVPAQAGTRVKELAAGKILVARRELLDPHFAETVVLLVQYDEKGTVGLIINRKTEVAIDAWEVLPASAGMIFDLHPESLWRRLAEEEGLQIAALGKDAANEESYRSVLSLPQSWVD